MPRVEWDEVSKRKFETGIDRGVLYLPDGSGVAWNGLTSVEQISSASVEEFYLDGIKYLQTRSSGDYAASLTAYTYPPEFEQFNGLSIVENGMQLDNQPVTEYFGLSYRTRIGNDISGVDHGYKIHVVYNLTASPSNIGYQAVSNTPEALDLTWSLTAIPEQILGYRPTAHLIFDTTKISPFLVQDIENLLYGEAPKPDNSLDVDFVDGGEVTSSGSGVIDGKNLSDSADSMVVDGGSPFDSETAGEEPEPTLPARLPSMADLIELVTTWTLIPIVDNGDGTWTATAPDQFITMLDATTFQITTPMATYLDEDTYQISSTHGF